MSWPRAPRGSSYEINIHNFSCFFRRRLPYVEGGVAFSRITDLAEIPSLNHRSNFGIVLGAGLEVELLVVRISPEIRYNGWTLPTIQDPAGQFQSNRNQAMFQEGFGF